MKYYIEAFKKYATFKGRARRKEFWIYILVSNIMYAILTGAAMSLGEQGGTLAGILGLLSMAVGLVHLLPSLAVSVRRLHDTGRSGWWLLLGFLPVIGILVLLFFYASDSDPQANDYGPSPKRAQGKKK